ncbi:MAG TPA: hypothetical protein VN554_00995 [Verrucomicrobiae bacterium]|nr:hypothetical protein [Verrucomicrobiae bacterium]
MSPEFTLGAIVLAPAVALMVLRINATLVFLSLCLGDVLVQFVANDVNGLTHSIPATLTNDNVKLGLLLIPPVLTAIFMVKTIHGNSRLLLNLLPAAGAGLLGALLAVPLLPKGLSRDIVVSPLWSQVTNAQGWIVGATALVCLVVLWLQRPKAGGHKHKKH